MNLGTYMHVDLETKRFLKHMIRLHTRLRKETTLQFISMTELETAVTPLLMHWSHCSLPLSHRQLWMAIFFALISPVFTAPIQNCVKAEFVSLNCINKSNSCAIHIATWASIRCVCYALSYIDCWE